MPPVLCFVLFGDSGGYRTTERRVSTYSMAVVVLGYLHKLSIIFNSTQPRRQESRAVRIDKILPVPRALCITHSSTSIPLGNKGLPLWRTQLVPGTVLDLPTLIFLHIILKRTPPVSIVIVLRTHPVPAEAPVPASTTSQHLSSPPSSKLLKSDDPQPPFFPSHLGLITASCGYFILFAFAVLSHFTNWLC